VIYRDGGQGRERATQLARLLGGLAIALLGAVLVLWALDLEHRLWRRLVSLAFVLAIGGTAFGIVGMRERRLRRDAVLGVAASAVAMVGAVLIRSMLPVR
jgi:hypothetical protein